uniref:Uncharacterized protein n=1 Tax=Pyrodinium bahamense TaxID=73915 RepID=A0A7S0ANQ5_9DINO|mmetsp:Transcript_38469/g.107180  ORF Transcript_38469/g.107180 Transcript_38469/m.107180 type:complete len:298 (+) Transcript_38469:55-948(+)
MQQQWPCSSAPGSAAASNGALPPGCLIGLAVVPQVPYRFVLGRVSGGHPAKVSALASLCDWAPAATAAPCAPQPSALPAPALPRVTVSAGPGLAKLAEPATAEAASPKLSRGARRRIQQRLRKKLGKLERMRMLEEEAAAAAGCTVEVAGVPTASTQGDATSLPIHACMRPARAVRGAALPQKIVPVCEIQQVARLHESKGGAVPTLDFPVTLPIPRPVPQQAAPERAQPPISLVDVSLHLPAVLQEPFSSCPPDAARAAPSLAAASCPGIPTANTFVHFPATGAAGAERPRRSLSV